MMIYCMLSYLVVTTVIIKTEANKEHEADYYREGNFADVRKLPTFTDRTLFIKYVFPKSDKQKKSCTAYIAPRRFGKTVNLDMIRRFFGAECDEFGNILPQKKTKYYELFKDLKIFTEEKHFAEEHFAKYPVVHIDLAKYGIEKDYNAELGELTALMYEQHMYLSTSNRLSSVERKLFSHTHVKLVTQGKFQKSDGGRLLNYLSKHFGRPVIMVIDELDTPAIKCILSSMEFGPVEEKALGKLVEYFRTMLKNDDNVLFSMLTGTTRIAGVLTHEINTLTYKSAFDDDELASYYGFFDEDIQLMAGNLGRSDLVDKLRSWYNGYKIPGSGRTVYNTLSVTASLTTGIIKSYWEAGPGLNHLKRLFEYRVLGEAVEASLSTPIQIKMVNKISKEDFLTLKEMVNDQKPYTVVSKGEKCLFFQYLLEQGYYTFDEVVQETHEEKLVNIKIPNEETRQALKGKLYTSIFFRQKYNVDFDAIHAYITSLSYLNKTETSVRRLKDSIAGIFGGKPPRVEDEFRAELYHMANAYGDANFDLVRAEKYVKMTLEQLARIDEKKAANKKSGKTPKPRQRAGGVYIDLLMSGKTDKPGTGHQNDENSSRVVKIVECKRNEIDRAPDALRQIIDNEYYILDENVSDLQKREIKETPNTMQFIGVSYTTKYGFELCVLFNSTKLSDAICVLN